MARRLQRAAGDHFDVARIGINSFGIAVTEARINAILSLIAFYNDSDAEKSATLVQAGRSALEPADVEDLFGVWFAWNLADLLGKLGNNVFLSDNVVTGRHGCS